jgi:hypothetical protein
MGSLPGQPVGDVQHDRRALGAFFTLPRQSLPAKRFSLGERPTVRGA